jgi:DNA helicase-2/ATP-dependent DNA helicase PcrA
LASNIDSRRSSGQRVSLSTIHAAKGKEWPIVCIIGLEEGVLPDRRMESDEDLAEERRVLYVGMTRAQEQLVLSFATSSRHNRPRQASRFLSDLPRELIRRGV